MSKDEQPGDFLEVLEQGVRDVLKRKSAKTSEKMAAITAGTKLLAIRYKINSDAEDSFFK